MLNAANYINFVKIQLGLGTFVIYACSPEPQGASMPYMYVRLDGALDVAERFAKHQEITNFKASKGWLHRFKQRHCISNRKAHGEIADADTRFIEDLRKDFLATVEKYKLSKP